MELPLLLLAFLFLPLCVVRGCDSSHLCLGLVHASAASCAGSRACGSASDGLPDCFRGAEVSLLLSKWRCAAHDCVEVSQFASSVASCERWYPRAGVMEAAAAPIRTQAQFAALDALNFTLAAALGASPAVVAARRAELDARLGGAKGRSKGRS